MEYYKTVIIWKRGEHYFARIPCQCKLYTEKFETTVLPVITYRVDVEIRTEDCESKVMRPSEFREDDNCYIDIIPVELLRNVYVVEGDSPLCERVSYSKKRLASSFPGAIIEEVEVDGHLDEDDCIRYGRPKKMYDEGEGLSDLDVWRDK